MKGYIVRLLIDYCCKQALKYEQRKEMLCKEEEFYIYTIGSNILQKEKWLKRIKKLEESIGKG